YMLYSIVSIAILYFYTKKKAQIFENLCLFFVYLGFYTNPKNGRVKALSKACLDRTYLLIVRITYHK
ncbi:MAG: hypothetical protein J6C25_08825, partial [Treponema sp.]|nr:hypothetical protein [Treponema sp.]